MAAQSLAFHMPEEANPSVMLAILEVWAATPDRCYKTSKELLASVREVRDIPDRAESVNFALRLGLIGKGPDGLELTPLALSLSNQRSAIGYDVMHYLAYTAWGEEADEPLIPFWSYQSTCDALWQASSAVLADERNRLVEHIIAASQERFANNPFYDPRRVSYSGKSVRAILKWLEPLTPPVICNGTFQRRSACSSELMLLAVAHAYRASQAEPGVELLLTSRVRDDICRLCLFDPAYLDRILDWALARHASFVERADQSGTYGRSVRLRSLPTVQEVLAAR